MKKILFGLFIFLFFPIITLADNYTIESYIIDVDVLENGDAEVSEIVLINGTLDYYTMNLYYENNTSFLRASGISNIKVSGLKTSNISFNTFSDTFTEYTLVNTTNNEENNVYTVNDLNGGYKILIYHPIDGERYAFKLNYTIEDAIIAHNYFAEFYWNFFPGELSNSIHNLSIRVTLPGLDESENLNAWIHEPFSGEITLTNSRTNNIILVNVEELGAHDVFDVRITFDDNLVDDLTRHSDETLNEVIEEENERIQEASISAEEIRSKYRTSLIITVIFYIALVASAIYIYIRYDRERKAIYKLKYNQEFINDYDVEVIDYLMHKNITDNALSASIMNLIYKKNIKVEVVPEVKDEYRFILISRNALNDAENVLIDFLFKNVAKNTASFTISTFKRYVSDPKTCQTFINTYNDWKKMVSKMGETQELFENKKIYIIFPIILLVISLLLVIYIMWNNVDLIPGVITVFIAIIFLIYVLSFRKKTQKGTEHYARWQSFKKFLNDFGNFNINYLPKVILWDRYLVYATVFGSTKKVEKNMNVKLKEIGTTDANQYAINNMLNMHLVSLITSLVHYAINSSQTAIKQMDSSPNNTYNNK